MVKKNIKPASKGVTMVMTFTSNHPGATNLETVKAMIHVPQTLDIYALKRIWDFEHLINDLKSDTVISIDIREED